MQKLYGQLLKNKFLILVLVSSLLSFLGLYIAETYFSLAPRVSEVIRGFAMALLTSGVVGFVFEYLTRKEFTTVIQMTVHNEIEDLEYRLIGKADDENLNLFAFWRPFLNEGASIVIAQDESGVEPLIRASDVSIAFHLYKGLIEKFAMPDELGEIEITQIPKVDSEKGLCSFEKHLIIVGAPGANPFATLALNKLHNVPTQTMEIKDGYVFAVDTSRPQKYLECPYIVSCGGKHPGIVELREGEVVRRFERYSSPHEDGYGRDCCLIDFGVFSCDNGHTHSLLLIAGHSRFSTLDGVNFVLNNQNWGKLMREKKELPATTILEASEAFAERTVTMAKTP
jgi:hypothetical protein